MEKLGWMTFYALTQKTINRGTENQFSPPGFDNCWYAEMDFLESPFWSDQHGNRACYLNSFPHASFFSTGAQFGGCFPMGTNMGNNWAKNCSTEWCCEAYRCPKNYKGFINPSDYGSEVAGCVPQSVVNPPPGTVFVGPKSSPKSCSDFDVLGGCRSDSFFDNDPNAEYIFSFVVDYKGVYSYRWQSTVENFANSIWPGIKKFSADPVLKNNKPIKRPTSTGPPCLRGDQYCLLFHPGSPGSRSCVTAGGDPKMLDNMPVATAAGKNWWDLMLDTGQWWDYEYTILNKCFSNNGPC